MDTQFAMISLPKFGLIFFPDSYRFFASLCYGNQMTIMEETKNRIKRGMG
jgi:hypothetical protein